MNRLVKNNKMLFYLSSGISLILIASFAFSFFSDDIEPKKYAITSLSISPGGNETQINFSWITSDGYDSSVVEVTKEAGQSGDSEVQQTESKMQETADGMLENEATINGLEPETDYSYRLGDGKGNWTEKKRFKTQKLNKFNFLLFGDPQLGSSGDLEIDERNWTDTLTKALSKFPESSFIQSVGDQVEKATSKEQYHAFGAPEILETIPLAATVGNHDHGILYQHYFNMPNQSTELGETEETPGNYYYTYGNMLIMNLNSNSNNMEEHIQFMEETLAATENLDLKWKLLVFHHSIYSSGKHKDSTDVLALREALVPAIDKLEVDAVLMGHDHSYTRTYQMEKFTPMKNQEIQEGAVINPSGTFYLTANSSSGSKYYALATEEQPYAAVKEQLKVPTFTNVAITDVTLEFTTFRTDKMEITDSYKIVKDASVKVERPSFDSVNIAATGKVLATEPIKFYPEVLITVTGVNTEGGPFDLPYDTITYKTLPDGKISIDQYGKVTVLEGADPGKLDIWAEIDVEGKKIETDKIQIELVKHKENELVTKESIWNYLDDGSNQGSAWREVEFDDSGWKTGKAPFGYPAEEDRSRFGEVKTRVEYGEDEANKFATTYFRTEFEIEDASSIGNIGYIQYEVDDSLILYLNGSEIGRFNLPEGEVAFDDYVRDVTDGSIMDESRTEKFYLNEEHLKNLKDGKNVLGAEVHQDRPDSSDFYWAMDFSTD